MRWLLLAVLSLPAMACLNDTEVARQDGEFRGGYPDAPAAATTAQPEAPAPFLAGWGGFVAGAGLSALVGAVLWRRRVT